MGYSAAARRGRERGEARGFGQQPTPRRCRKFSDLSATRLFQAKKTSCSTRVGDSASAGASARCTSSGATHMRVPVLLRHLPRGGMSTDLRVKITNLLCKAFNIAAVNLLCAFGPTAPLARHIIMRPPGEIPSFDVIKELEQQVADACRSWRDHLKSAGRRQGEAAGLDAAADLWRRLPGGL